MASRPLLIVVSALFALAASFGCSPQTEPGETAVSDSPAPVMQSKSVETLSDLPPETGDWLVQQILSDPEQLNPLTSNDATASSILARIMESLLDRDPETLQMRPLLAASLPTVSDDHLTYTFTLRDDAHFSDGKPVTIDDVLFSIKAIKAPQVNAPFLRVYFSSIIKAEAVGKNQVRFTASEPYFLNEEVLGGITILPKHIYDPQGHLDGVSIAQILAEDKTAAVHVKAFADAFNRDFSRNPVGSGPYLFDSWDTGQRVILLRDKNYWGAGHEGIETPYIDRRVYRVINNSDAALVALKSGDLDSLGLDPLQHLRQTSGKKFTSQYNKLMYYAPGYTYIGWNNQHPIFADPKVRRAMTMLTNRKSMAEAILFGLGQVINSPIYRFRPEYNESLDVLSYDPAAAKALLAEAGWGDQDGDGILDKQIDGIWTPLIFELKINSGNDIRKSVALTLQDEMKRHGIIVRIRELDWTIFLDDVRNHRFDALVLGWSMSVNPPDGYQVWHSSQIENRGSNFIGFKNERVDAILDEYRRQFDPAKRVALYQEFQQILNQQQPYTFLFMRRSIQAYSKRFKDVSALPIGGPVSTRWWVPKAAQKYTP